MSVKRRILIIDDYDDLATELKGKFGSSGYFVEKTENAAQGAFLESSGDYDVVITDLDVPSVESSENGISRSLVRFFKINADKFSRNRFDEKELRHIFETVLKEKARLVDRYQDFNRVRERIEFVFPSAISPIHAILDYLVARIGKMGVVNLERSNLFVALDEAFVNAVKHGNKFDVDKMVRIVADVSPEEVRIIVEDEGEGFNVDEIPDPTSADNVMKTSGRGILIIKNVMDEVRYSEKGNRLEMVKRVER